MSVGVHRSSVDLLIRVGERQYAIPSIMVEQVQELKLEQSLRPIHNPRAAQGTEVSA